MYSCDICDDVSNAHVYTLKVISKSFFSGTSWLVGIEWRTRSTATEAAYKRSSRTEMVLMLLNHVSGEGKEREGEREGKGEWEREGSPCQDTRLWMPLREPWDAFKVMCLDAFYMFKLCDCAMSRQTVQITCHDIVEIRNTKKHKRSIIYYMYTHVHTLQRWYNCCINELFNAIWYEASMWVEWIWTYQTKR